MATFSEYGVEVGNPEELCEKIMVECEECKKQYAGIGEQDYCLYCSKNLCSPCMEKTDCEESVIGKHTSAISIDNTIDNDT